ncbi:MAG: protein-methionine-sulfoxide reductase heme-binding subunit MsrQ [Gemmatimonadota bacterium]
MSRTDVDQETRSRGAPPEPQATIETRPRNNRKAATHIKEPRWLHGAVIAASFIPFIWAGLALASDVFRGTNYLTAEPVTEIEHFTGKWTLRFLALTLAITPAVAITRLGWLIKYRRTFGLFAFLYACTHFALYLTLDLELYFSEIWEDITERPYITIGFTALMLLVPLALTSTKASIRRLGGKRWNALHRLIYVTSVLGVVHFWMSVKRDLTSPILFSLLFATLLGWRVWQALRARA